MKVKRLKWNKHEYGSNLNKGLERRIIKLSSYSTDFFSLLPQSSQKDTMKQYINHYRVQTAGVLENSAYIREHIAIRLKFLGITLDEKANDFRGKERIISTPDSKTILMVVPTNEELMIMRDTRSLLK